MTPSSGCQPLSDNLPMHGRHFLDIKTDVFSHYLAEHQRCGPAAEGRYALGCKIPFDRPSLRCSQAPTSTAGTPIVESVRACLLSNRTPPHVTSEGLRCSYR